MDLKITNNIDNNIFSTHVTVDALGTEQLSEDEERELISNFPVKLAYRNLKFTKNIKINGIVPEIVDNVINDNANGNEIDNITSEKDESVTYPETNSDATNNVVAVSLPPLSNKEFLIDENFDAYYKIDCAKISPSVLDEKVITTKEIAAQAYCLIFSQVVCDAVREIMGELRKKAPAFEGEQIVSV